MAIYALCRRQEEVINFCKSLIINILQVNKQKNRPKKRFFCFGEDVNLG
jgi:hypothetical protein